MAFYLYGASGHGKVIVEIAEELNFSIDGFIDGNHELKSVFDYKVIHEVPSSINQLVISIGNNTVRKKFAEQYHNLEFITLIHPKSNISTRAVIGKGTVIVAGATINSEVTIGDHCIINTNATIDHECIIENYVHVSPNATLAGNVKVGEGTHIGIGAAVIQGIKIGKWCTIGAGAVIIKDIPDGSTVVGNPGRIIKNTAV